MCVEEKGTQENRSWESGLTRNRLIKIKPGSFDSFKASIPPKPNHPRYFQDELSPILTKCAYLENLCGALLNGNSGFSNSEVCDIHFSATQVLLNMHRIAASINYSIIKMSVLPFGQILGHTAKIMKTINKVAGLKTARAREVFFYSVPCHTFNHVIITGLRGIIDVLGPISCFGTGTWCHVLAFPCNAPPLSFPLLGQGSPGGYLSKVSAAAKHCGDVDTSTTEMLTQWTIPSCKFHKACLLLEQETGTVTLGGGELWALTLWRAL